MNDAMSSTTNAHIHIAITAATGRMGRELLSAATATDGITLAGAAARADNAHIGKPLTAMGIASNIVLEAAITAPFDVLIDFSAPAHTLANLATYANHNNTSAFVIGTTGFDDAAHARIAEAAKQCAIVLAPNTSVGVHALHHLVAEAAKLLDDADIELTETHHRHKKDAPSGTALALLATLKNTLAKAARTTQPQHGREGAAPRGADEIGVHAVRTGSVIGEHVVQFGLAGERIELAHRTDNRAIYAHGALRAAKWVAGKRPGLYTMADVLGLSPRT